MRILPVVLCIRSTWPSNHMPWLERPTICSNSAPVHTSFLCVFVPACGLDAFFVLLQLASPQVSSFFSLSSPCAEHCRPSSSPVGASLVPSPPPLVPASLLSRPHPCYRRSAMLLRVAVGPGSPLLSCLSPAPAAGPSTISPSCATSCGASSLYF